MDEVGGVSRSNASVSFKHVEQALPFDVFHDEKMPAVLFLGIERLHNARMRQFGERLGLALEASNGVGIMNALGRQNLDGYPAVQARIIRQEHRPHPALAEFIEELITAQLFQGRGRADGFVGGHEYSLLRVRSADNERALPALRANGQRLLSEVGHPGRWPTRRRDHQVRCSAFPGPRWREWAAPRPPRQRPVGLLQRAIWCHCWSGSQ